MSVISNRLGLVRPCSRAREPGVPRLHWGKYEVTKTHGHVNVTTLPLHCQMA